jgi:hypothetical protein
LETVVGRNKLLTTYIKLVPWIDAFSLWYSLSAMVHLKTSFLGAILSVACVLALPNNNGPAPDPRAIPISKHNDALAKRADGRFPGVERFQAQIARTKA